MKLEFELSKEELSIFLDTVQSKYHEIYWSLKLTESHKSGYKKMEDQLHSLRLVLNQINKQLEVN